jgi:mannosylglycoprotein endo-beta-mannosidase
MRLRLPVSMLLLLPLCASAQTQVQTVEGWAMHDAAKVAADGAQVSSPKYDSAGWYKATVPGTVLTTLVDNHVYPEPLYGENMRAIPESLNKASYWYRATLTVPRSYSGRRTWLHFGGVNYSAQIWLNGKQIGVLKGAFLRGDFDITEAVKPGKTTGLAVLVSPQPHPGTPHEHTVANGTGHNGGETAIDGPTFLSTIGWDWLMAVRDRATGLWQPVTLSDSGPVTVETPQVVSHLSPALDAAGLDVSAKLLNHSGKSVAGVLVGTISGEPNSIVFRKPVQLDANGHEQVSLDASTTPALHLDHPKLWWPNGYGEPNLHHLVLRFEVGKSISDETDVQFGIRKVDYQVPGSDVLTLVVNNVKVMVRGGNWGLDEAMKRIPSERLEAQVRMHALANLNLIRNWVGQSTSPDLYKYADKYGIMLWDEFFQPNPGDGPNVTDYDTYLANVTDKVLRYRNHPSIVVWCARNEGHPPAALDAQLAALMKRLDPERLYQSSSTDGRGVSSHGPYYWRAPQFFYQINEAFKTETGSVSVPTLESIQGMMPQKDWETINDDWAQHDMAAGAQRGNEYPKTLAHRYGPIRNLADFTRKAQMANYEAFRAMYESRNATMFQNTTGVITWMSHPAQPSFVWQLYHYDLEPNASLFAVCKAAEPVHVQLNEALRTVQVVNNRPTSLTDLLLTQTVYRLDGSVSHRSTKSVDTVPASSTVTVNTLWIDPHISEVYFLKLDLRNKDGKLLSTNFYWKNVAQDDFTRLNQAPPANLTVAATARQESGGTLLDVTVSNPGSSVALLAHLQLHRKADGARALPVFYSDNYLSLAPGESRQLTIEADTRNVAGGPLLLLDGYNVGLKESQGSVETRLNVNAQPEHWPASQIVPTGGLSRTERQFQSSDSGSTPK